MRCRLVRPWIRWSPCYSLYQRNGGRFRMRDSQKLWLIFGISFRTHYSIMRRLADTLKALLRLVASRFEFQTQIFSWSRWVHCTVLLKLLDKLGDFWMCRFLKYARRPFSPKEVFIFSNEKNATRIRNKLTLVKPNMIFRMVLECFRSNHGKGVKR